MTKSGNRLPMGMVQCCPKMPATRFMTFNCFYSLSSEYHMNPFYHLIKWTLGHMKNAAASLRRLAMLRLPVLCCHHLAYIERWTVRCLLLSCSLPFPLFLFHTLWPFVFPSLSSSLVCSFCMLYWIKTVLFCSIRCTCWIFLLTLQWITNTIEDYANYRQ